MRFSPLSFKDFKKLLFQLEFQTVPTSGNHYIFEHFASSALVILPKYQDQAYVDKTHLVAVHRILIEYDLINDFEFDSILEKVPS